MPRNSHLRRIIRFNGLGRDRDVGVVIDVGVDHLAVVHAIQMIAREDQVIVRFVALEMPSRLPDGVCSALEPVRVLWCLLGCEDLDEAVREHIHTVGLADMPIERGRVELRQDEDAPDVGVQARADGDVDQPVLAAYRHRRLRAQLREGKEARTAATTEDDREDVRHARKPMQCRCTMQGAPGPC
jgi:hypothetical protein